MPPAAARIAASTALLTCACSAPEVTGLPSDAAWVAFLFGGGAVDGTALVRVASDDPPSWPAREGDRGVRVVSWTDAAIRDLAPPDDRVLVDPVRDAGFCDLALPAPSFTAVRDGDATRVGSAGELPPLSTRWLASRCEPIDTEALLLRSDCQRGRCIPDRIEQDRCCLELDLTSCGLDTLRLAFDAGATAVDPSDGATCRGTPAEDGAVLSATCEEPVTCRVDVFDAPTPLALDVDRLSPFGDVPYRDPSAPDAAQVKPVAIVRGYTNELVVLGDEALVLGWGGTFVSEPCNRDTPDSELAVVDLEAFAVVSQAALPQCTDHAAPDPLGRGFVATYGVPPDHRIGLFDPRGGLLMDAPVPNPFPDDRLPTRMPAFTATKEPPHVAVALMSSGDEYRSTAFVSFDLTDLSWAATSSVERAHGFFLSPRRPGEVLLADDSNNELVTYDLGANRIVRRAVAGYRGTDLIRPLWVEALSLALQPATGPFGGVFAVGGPAGGADYAAFFLFDLEPTAAAPFDGSRFLVAGTDRTTERGAHLSLLLPEPRFLPTSMPLGRGAVSHAIPDGRGHVLLLLPWEGALVRASIP